MTTDPPDNAQVAFHPPILIVVAMLVAWGAGRLVALPLPFLADSIARAAGAPVVALAFALFVWSVLTMRSGGGSIPTGTPTERLVVRGPYRFTRNPIYLAMLILMVGMGLRTNNAWFLVLMAVSFALLSWGVISREERYLGRKIGVEYAEYRTRVRRWI